MCIFVCIFYINNTAKGNTSLMLNKLLLLLFTLINCYLLPFAVYPQDDRETSPCSRIIRCSGGAGRR